jgi:hypothetical protein
LVLLAAHHLCHFAATDVGSEVGRGFAFAGGDLLEIFGLLNRLLMGEGGVRLVLIGLVEEEVFLVLLGVVVVLGGKLVEVVLLEGPEVGLARVTLF